MNIMTMNDKAKNGRGVMTSVEILIEAVPHPKFRIETRVDYATLFCGHAATLRKAKSMASRMHKAYLKVHSK